MRMFAGMFAGMCAAAGCTGAEPPEVEPSEPTVVTSGDTTVTFGECEGYGTYRAADTGAEPVDVWAEVDGEGRIVAHLDNEVANCCPDPSASFARDGAYVVLTFSDITGSSGCDCMCIFDFVATSAPFPSGDYQLEVVYDGRSQAVVSVTVP